MAPNFSSILDKPATEIERPKPLPVGTYLCIIKGLPRYDKSSKKQTDFVEFTAVPHQAEPDVDKDELTAVLTTIDGTVLPLNSKEIKLTYYITEDAAWRLKKFLEDLGFDMADESVTMRQACEQSAGQQVYVSIKHQASQDGKGVFANAGDTAKVD